MAKRAKEMESLVKNPLASLAEQPKTKKMAKWSLEDDDEDDDETGDASGKKAEQELRMHDAKSES